MNDLANGGMPNMANGDMAKHLQQFQQKIAGIQAEGSAGGGLVKTVLGGNFNVLSIYIKPNSFNPGQEQVISDLLVNAYNQAHQNVAKQMQAVLTSNTPGTDSNNGATTLDVDEIFNT